MEPKGFLASLFDTSFANLVTPRVIRIIYIISMVVIGLAALFWIGAAFAQSAAFGLLVLVIAAPIVSLLYLIYTRVLLEVIIALFRIMESNVELVALQRAATPGAPAPSVPRGRGRPRLSPLPSRCRRQSPSRKSRRGGVIPPDFARIATKRWQPAANGAVFPPYVHRVTTWGKRVRDTTLSVWLKPSSSSTTTRGSGPPRAGCSSSRATRSSARPRMDFPPSPLLVS